MLLPLPPIAAAVLALCPLYTNTSPVWLPCALVSSADPGALLPIIKEEEEATLNSTLCSCALEPSKTPLLSPKTWPAIKFPLMISPDAEVWIDGGPVPKATPGFGDDGRGGGKGGAAVPVLMGAGTAGGGRRGGGWDGVLDNFGGNGIAGFWGKCGGGELIPGGKASVGIAVVAFWVGIAGTLVLVATGGVGTAPGRVPKVGVAVLPPCGGAVPTAAVPGTKGGCAGNPPPGVSPVPLLIPAPGRTSCKSWAVTICCCCCILLSIASKVAFCWVENAEGAREHVTSRAPSCLAVAIMCCCA